MHPQSITSIMASLENTKKIISTLNENDFSEERLRETIKIAEFHLVSLTKYVDYEIQYQSENISQKGLFELHRELIKDIEKKPVGELIKIR